MDIYKGRTITETNKKKKTLKMNGLLKSIEKKTHIPVEIWIEILNKF